MVTIKDLAKASGTSPSTASRALRGEGYVSEQVKERVLRVAQEIGYIPNYSAKILKSNESMSIGVIISDINNVFYNLYVEQLVYRFKQNGYRVNIMYSFENPEAERESFLTLLSYRVNAILFTPTTDENRDLIDLAKKNKTTLLQLFRKAYDDVASITVDDAHGAYLATKHLINEGCKKILLLSVNIKHTPHRSSGYKKAYEEADLEFNLDYIQKFYPNEVIKDKVQEVILKLEPDGIVAGTNTFGMNTIAAMKELPEKYQSIKLISFDDIEWFSMLKISTIAQPIDEIANSSYTYIMNNMGTTNPKEEHLKVTPHIIIR